jgi:hypothetical protein
MTVKFVFSSVPLTTTISCEAKSIPIGPEDHDHHYQVVLEEVALHQIANSSPLRLMFTQAAYKALRDGEHDSAAIYVSVFGLKISKPYVTIFDDASNHKAVQGVVDDAMQMVADLTQ